MGKYGINEAITAKVDSKMSQKLLKYLKMPFRSDILVMEI